MNKKLFLLLILLMILINIGLIYCSEINFLNSENFNNEIEFSDIVLYLGRMTGVLSFFLLGFTIFIGGSSKLLDKIFGLGKILRFHKKLAFFTICVLIFHPVLILYSNNLAGISVSDFLYSYIDYLPFICGLISFFLIYIIYLLSKYFFALLNYYLWLNLHRIVFIAFILAGFHLVKFAVFFGFDPTISLLNIFFVSGIIFALSGFIIRIVLLFFKKKILADILNIQSHNDKVNIIQIAKPADFKFKSGQFCFISFRRNGLKKPHPFTILSSEDDGIISFAVKDCGKFTSRINSLRKGDKVIIDGPYGKFVYKGRDSVFIAGGIGITPFRSILGDTKRFINGQEIKLIYINKREEDVLFKNWIKRLVEGKKYFNIEVLLLLSKEIKKEYSSGYITSDLLSKVAQNKSDFYVCCPPEMLKSIKKIIRNRKYKTRIFYEEFNV